MTKTASEVYISADGTVSDSMDGEKDKWIAAFGKALSENKMREESHKTKKGSCSRGYVKVADLMGVGSENELAAKVKDLAIGYIQDKSPVLFKNFSGYRILDSNEEGSKVILIFVFLLGSEYLYAPVFFLNGEILCDSLYWASQDHFYPLKENWVNWIASKISGQEFGHSVDRQPQTARFPDIRGIVTPYKRGSFDWQKFNNLPDNPVNLLKIASEDPKVFFWTANLAKDYPTINEGFDRFYGEGFFKRAWNNMLAGHQRVLKAQQKVAKEDKEKHKPHMIIRRSVTVICSSDPDAGFGLPHKNAAELVEKDVTVIDSREDDEVSQLEELPTFESPNNTGVYTVLMSNGHYKEVLVIVGPIGEQSERSLVVDWKKGAALRTRARAVLAVAGSYKEDWWNRLPANKFHSRSDMGTGEFKRRVFIDREGHGTIPLSSTGTNTGVARITPSYEGYDVSAEGPCYPLEAHRNADAQLTLYANRRDSVEDRLNRYNKCPDTLVYSGALSKGKCIARRDNKLILPSEFKYITLDDTSGTIISLATQSDLQQLIYDGVKSITVSSNNGNYRVSQKTGNYNDVFKHLIYDHNFREKDAADILKTADALMGQLAQIHYISPKTAGEQLMSPVFEDPQYVSDDYLGIQQQLPVDQMQQLAYGNTMLPDTMSFPPPDAAEVNKIQQAVSEGNKDVFDVEVLQSVLDENKDKTVFRYGAVFDKALDRLLRLLFKVRWSRETFKKQFGSGEVSKLEDKIEATADSLGDLTLFLKNKDNRADVSELYASADIDSQE